MDGGVFHGSQSLSLDIEVDKDIQTITRDIMGALRALSVTGKKNKEYLKLAIREMEEVQRREIIRRKDVEKNIDDMLQAINFLLSINSTDITEIRSMMDRLLKMWEGKWYFNK